MNSILIQRSMPGCALSRRPGSFAPPTAGAHATALQDTARTSSIDADVVTGYGLGGALNTSIALDVRLAQLESP